MNFLKIFLNVAFYVSGFSLFALGILGAADMVLGSKYAEILDNLNLLWIQRGYWVAYGIVVVLCLITYFLRKKTAEK